MKEREITRGIGRRVGQMWPHTAIRLPPPLRQPIKPESPAELRDLMRAEIRQLRADNQRLKSELAVSQRARSALLDAVCEMVFGRDQE